MTKPAPLELDVRPLLARGEEPFGAIMAAADTLAPEQSLRLIAPFRPVPLFNVMAKRGLNATDRPLPGGAWEVIFAPAAPAQKDESLTAGTALEAACWPDPARSIDLTGLMVPEPMVRILETLERMAPGEVLFALIDREPKFLFPELAQRGHDWAGNFAADGASYRLMVRVGCSDD